MAETVFITLFSKFNSDVDLDNSVEYFVVASVKSSEVEEEYPVKSKVWEASRERLVAVEEPS